jgi:hypothetical protein
MTSPSPVVDVGAAEAAAPAESPKARTNFESKGDQYLELKYNAAMTRT